MGLKGIFYHLTGVDLPRGHLLWTGLSVANLERGSRRMKASAFIAPQLLLSGWQHAQAGVADATPLQGTGGRTALLRLEQQKGWSSHECPQVHPAHPRSQHPLHLPASGPSAPTGSCR